MKYDSGMTYLNKDILAAVRLMCGNDDEITEKFSPNDGSPAPLRDYLKKKYSTKGGGCGGVHYFGYASKLDILLNKPIIKGDNDKTLILSWSQVTKFIRDNWDDVFRKETAENQPSPAAEKPAEADKPKPTYKDVLLEHYPNFDISKFDEFADKNCVDWFFKDDNGTLDCLYLPDSPLEDCKKCWERECRLKWGICQAAGVDVKPYLNENVPAEDTKTADLPNPPVPANADKTTALFDYSELDNYTAGKLQEAAQKIMFAKQRYIFEVAEQVKIAHDLLASHDKNKGMFGKWCENVGYSRKTGENLLHVAKLFRNISDDQRDNLTKLADGKNIKLLYEAARPSAPPELVEQVKNGDITTHADYIKLKKELEETLERSKAAQVEYENLHNRHYDDLEKWCAETSELKQRISELENRPLDAEAEEYQRQINKANKRAEEAEMQARTYRHNYLQMNKNFDRACENNVKLEEHIKELEARPVEVAVQQDERVLKELEQLREENERLKDKDTKNMLIRITLKEYEELLGLVKKDTPLYAALSRAEFIKL